MATPSSSATASHSRRLHGRFPFTFTRHKPQSLEQEAPLLQAKSRARLVNERFPSSSTVLLPQKPHHAPPPLLKDRLVPSKPYKEDWNQITLNWNSLPFKKKGFKKKTNKNYSISFSSTTSSYSSSFSSGPAFDLHFTQKCVRDLSIKFTHPSCNTESTRLINKESLHKGLVVVRCQGCKQLIVVADHGCLFEDEFNKGVKVEDVLRDIGLNRVVKNSYRTYCFTFHSAFQYSLPHDIGERKPPKRVYMAQTSHFMNQLNLGTAALHPPVPLLKDLFRRFLSFVSTRPPTEEQQEDMSYFFNKVTKNKTVVKGGTSEKEQEKKNNGCQGGDSKEEEKNNNGCEGGNSEEEEKNNNGCQGGNSKEEENGSEGGHPQEEEKNKNWSHGGNPQEEEEKNKNGSQGENSREKKKNNGSLLNLKGKSLKSVKVQTAKTKGGKPVEKKKKKSDKKTDRCVGEKRKSGSSSLYRKAFSGSKGETEMTEGGNSEEEGEEAADAQNNTLLAKYVDNDIPCNRFSPIGNPVQGSAIDPLVEGGFLKKEPLSSPLHTDSENEVGQNVTTSASSEKESKNSDRETGGEEKRKIEAVVEGRYVPKGFEESFCATFENEGDWVNVQRVSKFSKPPFQSSETMKREPKKELTSVRKEANEIQASHDREHNKFEHHMGRGAVPGELFIGGLAKGTTHVHLKGHFRKYGEIIDSVVMKDRWAGQPLDFGYIAYADPSVVEKVIQDVHIINGKQVRIKRRVPKGDIGFKVFKQKKIFVGGLPPTVTEDKLKDFFGKYGEVREHVIMRNHDTGRSRGFGFITFGSEGAVNDLLSKGNMIDLAGYQVEIKKAKLKKGNAPSPASKRRNDMNYAYGRDYGGFGADSCRSGSGFGDGSGASSEHGGSEFSGGYGGYDGSSLGGYASSEKESKDSDGEMGGKGKRKVEEVVEGVDMPKGFKDSFCATFESKEDWLNVRRYIEDLEFEEQCQHLQAAAEWVLEE